MFEMSVGDCFSFIQNGANIKQGEVDGGYPITRIETISNNRFNRDRMGYAGITDITPYRAYVLEDGDILMSHINSVRYLGRAVKYSKHDDETIIHGMNLLRLKAIREIVIPDYACLCFSSRHFREQISRITKKSVNQASFSVADLKRAKMLIASLEEQKQIVALMSRIDGIMQTRKAEYKALDQLIKARFVELFGELEKNEHGYPVMQLGDLVTDIIAGWSANGESRIKKENEKAVLKVSAVTQGFFKPDEHKALVDDLEIKKYVYPHKGDMLFSRANTRELVGATAIIEQDYPDLLLPDKLWRVLFSDTINVYYAKYALSMDSVRQEFSAQSTGTSGSMFNVSAEKFKSIRIPVPPIELQKQFAAFVSQVVKSKLSIQASLEQLETLKQSLMQKYFG